MNELRPFIRRKISFRKTQCVFRKKLHFSYIQSKLLCPQGRDNFAPALKSKKDFKAKQGVSLA
jgi:hypothetical protein